MQGMHAQSDRCKDGRTQIQALKLLLMQLLFFCGSLRMQYCAPLLSLKLGKLGRLLLIVKLGAFMDMSSASETSVQGHHHPAQIVIDAVHAKTKCVETAMLPVCVAKYRPDINLQDSHEPCCSQMPGAKHAVEGIMYQVKGLWGTGKDEVGSLHRVDESFKECSATV